MIKIISSLFLFFISISVYAQTTITVIGTMHNPTASIDSKTILAALQKIAPDVVLVELDSSLMDSTGKVLYQFKSNENSAVEELRKMSNVIVRPYDYKDRNKYYQQTKTFEFEPKFSKLLDSLYKSGSLDPASKTFCDSYFSINQVLRVFDNADLVTINKESTSALMELRQDMMYNGLLKVCESNPGMAGIKDFWKKNGEFWLFRNAEMTKNILKYTAQYRDKKIAVLAGYYHKYKLMQNLKQEQAKNNFVIKEFWEYK